MFLLCRIEGFLEEETFQVYNKVQDSQHETVVGSYFKIAMPLLVLFKSDSDADQWLPMCHEVLKSFRGRYTYWVLIIEKYFSSRSQEWLQNRLTTVNVMFTRRFVFTKLKK